MSKDSDQAARQSAGATACPHGVDDGACKQCYADAAGKETVGVTGIQAEIHRRIAPLLTRRQQGNVMQHIRNVLYAAPIGDNGAAVAELEAANFALAAGQCVHKDGVMMDDYGHTLCPLTKTDDAQPAESKRTSPIDRAMGVANKAIDEHFEDESKRVELTLDEIAETWTKVSGRPMYKGSTAEAFALALLDRAQAKE